MSDKKTESLKVSQDKSKQDATLSEELKIALSKENNRQKRIQILTTVPSDWTVRQIEKNLDVSYRSACTAKKLRLSDGYGSCPSKKTGRRLPHDVVMKVKEFYMDDGISRMMPGKKDCVKVVNEDGSSDRIQKRLLLFDIDEIHRQFCLKYADMKVSASKFTKLRPRNCITVGSAGTHNVCVCKIHQNLKLKFSSLNDCLGKSTDSVHFPISVVVRKILCENATDSCHLIDCQQCPGPEETINDIKSALKEKKIEKINYMQWTSTDRFCRT